MELTHHEVLQATKEIIAKRFTTTFGEPPTTDPEAFLNEYVRALTGTDINLLTRAVDYVIDHTESTYGTWPTPGTLRAAVTTVAERMAAHDARKFNAAADAYRTEPTKEQKARVDALMEATIESLKGGGWDLAKEKKKWAARQAAKY